jgi:hypothetical protein
MKLFAWGVMAFGESLPYWLTRMLGSDSGAVPAGQMSGQSVHGWFSSERRISSP